MLYGLAKGVSSVIESLGRGCISMLKLGVLSTLCTDLYDYLLLRHQQVTVRGATPATDPLIFSG